MNHEDDVQEHRAAGAGTELPDEQVRVGLALAGIRLSFSGRRAFFERHVAPLMEAMYARGPAQAVAEVRAKVEEAFTPTSPERFQQFAGQVGANAATVEQRVMAFAFYLWNYEKRESFDEDLIGSFFRTVHEEPPGDLPDLLATLSDGKRWLEPDASAAGAWRLTTKGVNYVKNRLLG